MPHDGPIKLCMISNFNRFSFRDSTGKVFRLKRSRLRSSLRSRILSTFQTSKRFEKKMSEKFLRKPPAGMLNFRMFGNDSNVMSSVNKNL